MNQYRMKDSGQIVTEQEYRSAYPNTQFPAVLKPDDADPILHSPAPEVDKESIAVRSGTKQDSLGNWIYDWVVVPKPPEQIAAEAKALIPQVISMVAARIVLIQFKLLDKANAYVASLEGDYGEEARVVWEYALTVRRDNDLVLGFAESEGWEPEQLDQLFIAGGLIDSPKQREVVKDETPIAEAAIKL